MDGQAIVSKAREYIGTRFHHQGRVKGVGVDCAGLVVGVARELGLEVEDREGYSRLPRNGELFEVVKTCGVPVEIAAAKAGDVLLFSFSEKLGPQHLGIVTEDGMMIHAWSKVKKVVEHNIDERWTERLHSAWRFKGVE